MGVEWRPQVVSCRLVFLSLDSGRVVVSNVFYSSIFLSLLVPVPVPVYSSLPVPVPCRAPLVQSTATALQISSKLVKLCSTAPSPSSPPPPACCLLLPNTDSMRAASPPTAGWRRYRLSSSKPPLPPWLSHSLRMAARWTAWCMLWSRQRRLWRKRRGRGARGGCWGGSLGVVRDEK